LSDCALQFCSKKAKQKTMKPEFSKHKLAYVVLVVGLVALTVAFMAVWPNRMSERGLILAISLFYFLWGVITHVKSEHISRRIVFEYASIALLASVALLLITL
jgi:hypothetical protein